MTSVLCPECFILQGSSSVVLPLDGVKEERGIVVYRTRPFLRFLSEAQGIVEEVGVCLPIRCTDHEIDEVLSTSGQILD